MPRYTRRRHRRRYRRRNPALIRGLPIPNLMDAGAAVAGGLGAKWIAKQVPFLNQATGYMQPLATFGVGIGLAFAAKMLRMGQFAKPIALGATIVAGIDLVKLAVPQLGLGEYYFPQGYNPALGAGGVGALPSGFMANDNLAEGEEQFMAETNLY